MARVEKDINEILNGVRFNEYGFPIGEEMPTYEELFPEEVEQKMMEEYKDSYKELSPEEAAKADAELRAIFEKETGFDYSNKDDIVRMKAEEDMTEEDALKLGNYRNPDDVLPVDIETPQKVKFMYDEYLGKIPFSDKMPKNIYNYIYAMELARKLANIPEKMHWKVLIKNKPKAVGIIAEMHDYTQPNIEIEIEPIQKVLKKWSLELADISKFKDVKDGKFVRLPSDSYDICPYNEWFSLDGLPEKMNRKDRELALKLHNAYEKWRDLKPKGYVSDEGLLVLDDFRPVKETDDAGDIRNLFWTTEKDIEYQSHKMMVLKGKVLSTTEYNKLHPTSVLDEYPKPNTKKYVEEPHPYDDRYVIIEGRVAHAGVPQDSPYYPRWKDDMDKTIDEVWELEKEYANEIITLEEEIKTLRRQFKERREYYFAKGVQVKSVDRVVKQLKKESKRTPQESTIEAEIYARLSANTDLMRKFNELNVA